MIVGRRKRVRRRSGHRSSESVILSVVNEVDTKVLDADTVLGD